MYKISRSDNDLKTVGWTRVLFEILIGFRPQSHEERNYFRPTHPTKEFYLFGIENSIAGRIDMKVGLA